MKLCKRTPPAPLLSSKTLPEVQLSHWLLENLVSVCWNYCHDLAIFMLFLPCAFLLCIISAFYLAHHTCISVLWAGLTFVLLLCGSHHTDISTAEQSHQVNFRAWMSFHFYSYLQNKGAKFSLLTVFRLLHQIHPEHLHVESHTLPPAPKSQVLAKSGILLLPLA